jgi:hypothetical protein
MKRSMWIVATRIAASLALAFAFAGSALASDWKQYHAKEYGYSMLIPSGAAIAERERAGGWGGFAATFEGVKVHGLAKLGPGESDADIERYAVRVIGIPASQWTLIDSGGNQRGWGRFKTFRATSGPNLYFGGYGVGPKGNYLIYVETTPADYEEHKADFNRWYESIRFE